MKKMMKMRSYQTVVLLLTKYSKRYIGFAAIEKVAKKYKYADEYKLYLMYKDLDIIDFEDNINFDRLSELTEMIESE